MTAGTNVVRPDAQAGGGRSFTSSYPGAASNSKHLPTQCDPTSASAPSRVGYVGRWAEWISTCGRWWLASAPLSAYICGMHAKRKCLPSLKLSSSSLQGRRKDGSKAGELDRTGQQRRKER